MLELTTATPAEPTLGAIASTATEERLYRVLRALFAPRIEALNALTPLDTLVMDSLDWVDLLSTIEDEFGIEVQHDYVEQVRCVGELARRIDALAHD